MQTFRQCGPPSAFVDTAIMPGFSLLATPLHSAAQQALMRLQYAGVGNSAVCMGLQTVCLDGLQVQEHNKESGADVGQAMKSGG